MRQRVIMADSVLCLHKASLRNPLYFAVAFNTNLLKKLKKVLSFFFLLDYNIVLSTNRYEFTENATRAVLCALSALSA